MEILNPDPAKRLTVHRGHLMLIEQKHLKEGRRGRLLPDIGRKTLERLKNSKVLADPADIRKNIEGPLGVLAAEFPRSHSAP